jgi:hypothetical protein
MIERVARAIYDELEGPVNYQDFSRQMRQWQLAKRLAVISARTMRYSDADEAIAIKSGQAIGVDAVLAIEAHDAWIDAALVGEG